ncbi:MAG TPA: HNH endonuclease [Polyangiaceae bacterium]|nr:HNH endonuclease [Polyangiaceae bacterium]
MRRLVKSQPPAILVANERRWLEEFKADTKNETRRTRYRHVDIKTALTTETASKCAYCESKIGHNTPGDVEHKVPSSRDVDKHFDWQNLTIACTECNRRKSNYYDKDLAFIDPYLDDVERMLVHCGPVVRWATGDSRAEIAVKTLGLLGTDRLQLICRKVEKLQEVADLLERRRATKDVALRTVLERQLLAMQAVTAEYSAMVVATLTPQHPSHAHLGI